MGVEAGTGGPTVKAVSKLVPMAVEKAIWGYVTCTRCDVDRLEFWDEGRARSCIRVTAVTKPLEDRDDQEAAALFKQMSSEITRQEIGCAEIFAKSGTHWMLLLFGRIFGHGGAKPGVIAKLFSAASHWGPGEESWQARDPTWLCTDSRDMLGNLTQQGRVIWHIPGCADAAPHSSWVSQKSSKSPLSAFVLLLTLAMLWSV